MEIKHDGSENLYYHLVQYYLIFIYSLIKNYIKIFISYFFIFFIVEFIFFAFADFLIK